MFVILLAGPDRDLARALRGGGARRRRAWQTFRHITLPQLAPLILLALTFRLLDAIKLFDIIFMMTGGGPGHQHLHRLVLPLPGRLPAVPSVEGDRRQLDLPGPDRGPDHGAGAPAAARGGRSDGQALAPARGAVRLDVVAAFASSACSCCSSWCRSTGS